MTEEEEEARSYLEMICYNAIQEERKRHQEELDKLNGMKRCDHCYWWDRYRRGEHGDTPTTYGHCTNNITATGGISSESGCCENGFKPLW